MNYDWNNITADKGQSTDKQTGSPTLSITRVATSLQSMVLLPVVACLCRRTMMHQLWGTPTSDRNVVVTATMPNTENEPFGIYEDCDDYPERWYCY